MANEVYANNMEVSCKAANGKAVAAFPDVCFTPPQTPATPPGVPIPYPNTGMASDTSDGSKTVKISDQEVMLKDKSYFKKSMGDEAGCAPKKGVITSKNMGKVYFTAWSMDVKAEGENVVRNMDMTTHNHASQPGNVIPWLYVDGVAVGIADNQKCKDQAKAFNDECGKHVKTHPDKSLNAQGTNDAMCSDPKCVEARKCAMTPNSMGCCGDKTAHHPIPVAELSEPRAEGQTRGTPRYPKYSDGDAPCVCVDGSDHDKRDPVSTQLMEHGMVGAKFAQARNAALPKGAKIGDPYPFSTALDCGAKAVSGVMKDCDEACTRKQLEAAHEKMGVGSGDKAFKSKQKANVPEFKKPPM